MLLTKDGLDAAELGSPEARVYALVPASGDIDQDELQAAAGAAGKVGMSKAVQNKWLAVNKGEGKAKLVSRAVAAVEDAVQAQLKGVQATGA